MCGRYTLSASPEEIADTFHAPILPTLTPRFNVAPTQTVAVVGLKPDGKSRGLALLRWGLVPNFASDPKPGPTNARGETVDRLPTFRESFRDRRCILPMSGFYEWRLINGKKVPHHFTLADGGLMGVAGIWDVWRGDNQKLVTCCLITTSANELVRPIHDRMPVILPPETWTRWLGSDSPTSQLLPLLAPYAGEMRVSVASTSVNSPRNEGPELLAA